MDNGIRKMLRSISFSTIGLIVALAVFSWFSSAAFAQQTETDTLNNELFGDIFAHPRDRSYLPGQAPSRGIYSGTSNLEDGRGQVNRYEYSKGKSVITRETWKDERGESQARIGIGRKF